MSEVTTINEMMAAVPATSSLDGRSVVLTDASGDFSKMDAELAYFKMKCKCLFGTDRVHLKRNFYVAQYSNEEWKHFTNIATGWSVSKAGSSEGDIVVVISKSKEGNAVTLYARCTSNGTDSNRMCQGLLLEVEGYQPYWSTSVTAL